MRETLRVSILRRALNLRHARWDLRKTGRQHVPEIGLHRFHDRAHRSRVGLYRHCCRSGGDRTDSILLVPGHLHRPFDRWIGPWTQNNYLVLAAEYHSCAHLYVVFPPARSVTPRQTGCLSSEILSASEMVEDATFLKRNLNQLEKSACLS